MSSIIFDPEAKDEFLEAVQYYEGCQEGLGYRFRLAIDSATQKIAKKPFMYRVLKAPFRRRLLEKFPYSIVYSIEPDHIRIIAIAHNKHKPGYWQERSAKVI